MTTTALLKRIEDEKEAARQAAWAERAAGEQRRRNPRWACDTLIRNGQITASQHTAAARYASLLERSHVENGAGGERVDGGDSDIHARLWDASISRSVARSARLFVLRAPSLIKTRMHVMDALFAFPQPTMAQMQRSPSGAKYPYEFAVRRIAGVLDLLDVFFTDRDRGYGR